MNRTSAFPSSRRSLSTAIGRAAVAGPLLAVSLFAGCAVAPHARPGSDAPPPTTQSMTLHAGDKLELKFYYAPELNDTQQIRPDGKITLQLLGDIQASGRTPDEFSKDLQAAYAPQLKYPQVSVIVREMQTAKVYVTGEVERPGPVDLPGNMSAFDAIMASGGFSMTTAATNSVIVMRQVNGHRVGYKLDYANSMKGGEHAEFALLPQDIVYVPRTAITNVDNFVEQYISNVVPQTGFVYTSNSGNHQIGVVSGNR